jgi:hypothetical protein
LPALKQLPALEQHIARERQIAAYQRRFVCDIGYASPRGTSTIHAGHAGLWDTEFKMKVPGNFTLVDHALRRAERGLAGMLRAEGSPDPDIYNGQVMPGMGH